MPRHPSADAGSLSLTLTLFHITPQTFVWPGKRILALSSSPHLHDWGQRENTAMRINYGDPQFGAFYTWLLGHYEHFRVRPIAVPLLRYRLEDHLAPLISDGGTPRAAGTSLPAGHHPDGVTGPSATSVRLSTEQYNKLVIAVQGACVATKEQAECARTARAQLRNLHGLLCQSDPVERQLHGAITRLAYPCQILGVDLYHHIR
jgi:hypothetical protein